MDSSEALRRLVFLPYDALRESARRGCVFLLAQIPVIGPHHDDSVAADLLIRGKKPIGWIPTISVPAFGYEPSLLRTQRESILRLNEAVTSGRLIRIDVTQKNPNRPADDITSHYAQPDQAQALREIATYNSLALNGAVPPALAAPFGDYLGYRKRDQYYWSYSIYLPRKLQKLFIAANVHLTQPAYYEWVTRDRDVERSLAALRTLSPEAQARALAELGSKSSLLKVGAAGTRGQRLVLDMIARLPSPLQVEVLAAPDLAYRLASGRYAARVVRLIEGLPTSSQARVLAAPTVAADLIWFKQLAPVVEMVDKLTPEERAPILAQQPFLSSLASFNSPKLQPWLKEATRHTPGPPSGSPSPCH